MAISAWTAKTITLKPIDSKLSLLKFYGSVTGDGTGGTIEVQDELIAYFPTESKVWIKEMQFANSDNIARLFNISLAASFEHSPGINDMISYVSDGMLTDIASMFLSNYRCRVAQFPYYLGRPIDTSAIQTCGCATNTNTKLYKFYSQYYILMP